jgi:hypothetical protein
MYCTKAGNVIRTTCWGRWQRGRGGWSVGEMRGWAVRLWRQRGVALMGLDVRKKTPHGNAGGEPPGYLCEFWPATRLKIGKLLLHFCLFFSRVVSLNLYFLLFHVYHYFLKLLCSFVKKSLVMDLFINWWTNCFGGSDFLLYSLGLYIKDFLHLFLALKGTVQRDLRGV